MSGSDYERELKQKLIEKGWLVFRSAGSFVCDLIAVKPKEHILIEVKSTKQKAFYTGAKENKQQFDMLNNLAKEGFNVYYYIRWKGKKRWSCEKLPQEPYPVFRRENATES